TQSAGSVLQAISYRDRISTQKEALIVKGSKETKRNWRDHSELSGVSRRDFVRDAAAIAAVATAVSIEPLLSGKESVAEAADGTGSASTRANNCFQYRMSTAVAERLNVGPQPGNGDIAKYTDFSANYSKGLLHHSLGVPDAASYNSMTNALASGDQE